MRNPATPSDSSFRRMWSSRELHRVLPVAGGMKNEGLMLKILGRMALDVDGRLGVKGLSAEEENAAESLADEGLAEWVDEHPFYGWHITVEGHDRLAQGRG